MQKVLLSSGGMDSWLLAHEPELKDAIHVYVDVGQKYLEKERAAAYALATETNSIFEIVRGPNLAQYEHSSGIIPFRNAQLIMLSALYGEAIYFGVIADEINSDKSQEFVAAMESVLNISHRKQYWTDGKQYQIRTPFRNFTKTELVQRYHNNGGSLAKLLTSVSCYDGGAEHCGRCASCFKRWVALVNVSKRNDWKEWGFVENPYTWKSDSEWFEKTKAYGWQRASEILDALAFAEVHA